MTTETPPSYMPIENNAQNTTSIILISRESPQRVLLTFHNILNKWVPPGGHQEAGESPIDTGVREVLEETGIDITVYIPPKKQLNDDTIALPTPQYLFQERIETNEFLPMHDHLDFVYIIFIPYQDARPQSKETHQTKWFPLDETKNIPLFDNVKYILESLRYHEPLA